ncbi:unnamed protein product [Caenorhabditis sp. 36 PRJEB53466]|nr:unnamed protein product [Caenorhabditis sp. 36 PRJEB53466]
MHRLRIKRLVNVAKAAPWRARFSAKDTARRVRNVGGGVARSVMNTDAKENRKVVPLDARPSTYHCTPITDMMLLTPDLLVSSGYDGVIKIWK